MDARLTPAEKISGAAETWQTRSFDDDDTSAYYSSSTSLVSTRNNVVEFEFHEDSTERRRQSFLSQRSTSTLSSTYNVVLNSIPRSNQNNDNHELPPLVSKMLLDDPKMNVEEALAERSAILGSIQRLLNHVPLCVIHDLIEEIDCWKTLPTASPTFVVNDDDDQLSVVSDLSTERRCGDCTSEALDSTKKERTSMLLASREMNNQRKSQRSGASYSFIMANLVENEERLAKEKFGVPRRTGAVSGRRLSYHTIRSLRFMNQASRSLWRDPTIGSTMPTRLDQQEGKLRVSPPLRIDQIGKETDKQEYQGSKSYSKPGEAEKISHRTQNKAETTFLSHAPRTDTRRIGKVFRRGSKRLIRKLSGKKTNDGTTNSTEYELSELPDPDRHHSNSERQVTDHQRSRQFWASTNHLPRPAHTLNNLVSTSSCRMAKRTEYNSVDQPAGDLQCETPLSPIQTESRHYLPLASKHSCALLFLDISGFTKLSMLLDPENLSSAINSYFHLLVNEVTSSGGDILKFAGDALFAEWQAESVFSPSTSADSGNSLAACVLAASTCGARIVSKYSNYVITTRGGASTGEQVATLNVHCGVSAGEVVGIHVGDNRSRREYLLLGEAILQATDAASSAAHCEVVACPLALSLLSQKCFLDDRVYSAPPGQPAVIAQQSTTHFSLKQSTRGRNVERPPFTRTISKRIEGWSGSSLREYRKLISLYVHPVIVDNDLASLDTPQSKSTVQRHREEAQLRTVYVMFLKPLVSVEISGDSEKDTKLFELLNNIMKVACRELDRFHGHLRQFIVDDKGLVLIATFGLRGSSCPNMVSERALPATTAIHNAMKNELNVLNRIGATIGDVYCGIVGGIKRHEYAVMGPSVNLAARLMSSPRNPGILVDGAVRDMAESLYGFDTLSPVKAKGYSEPVQIFQPLASMERRWGGVRPNFVGRKKETRLLLSMAKEILRDPSSPSKIAFLTAASGMGKSSTVVYALEHLRRVACSSRKRIIVAKHGCNNGDRFVPFSIFRTVFLDILIACHDEDSLLAESHGDIDETVDSDCVSFASEVSSPPTRPNIATLKERMFLICSEIDAPLYFIKFAGSRLLGTNETRPHENERWISTTTSSVVRLIVKSFLRCTQHHDLVVVALDDVHHMDEMSWKVVQELFEKGQNILVVCTSHPQTQPSQAVDKRFWTALEQKYQRLGRFVPLQLTPLNEDDIRRMIKKTLGVGGKEISNSMCRDVLLQSGGLPHFANEILQQYKKSIAVEQKASKSSFRSDNAKLTFEEFIVHRIDSFDATVRHVLNLGAVMGSTFHLAEVIEVNKRCNIDGQEQASVRAEKICASLDMAVQAGILYEVYYPSKTHQSGDGSQSDTYLDLCSSLSAYATEDRSYSFCHELWRSSILKLMLGGRKRDMHRIIATTLEARAKDKKDHEYNLKLLSHWNASGDFLKAASLAMSIGRGFEELGFHLQSIQLYEDTLAMWRKFDPSDDTFLGFSPMVLHTIGAAEMQYIIKIFVALGQCQARIHQATESLSSFHMALMIFRECPASKDVENKSIAFPIYSGLFMLMTFGEADQNMYGYEFVRQFVCESRLNGDPVHVSRALAMQAEMHARLGNFDEALEVHRELESLYSEDEHSASICKEYGSDWCAQSFGARALWSMEQGNKEEALRASRYVIDELMPRADLKDVHNSCLMLYPVLWVMEENGLALEARQVFLKYVVDRCPEGTFSFCIPIYEPVLMLLELSGKKHSTVESMDEYVEWALQQDNLRFGLAFSNAMGALGRQAHSISAEICLLLANRIDDRDVRVLLIRNGLAVASESVELSHKCTPVIADCKAKIVLRKLEELARETMLE